MRIYQKMCTQGAEYKQTFRKIGYYSDGYKKRWVDQIKGRTMHNGMHHIKTGSLSNHVVFRTSHASSFRQMEYKPS